jgi:hypothetical protein
VPGLMLRAHSKNFEASEGGAAHSSFESQDSQVVPTSSRRVSRLAKSILILFEFAEFEVFGLLGGLRTLYLYLVIDSRLFFGFAKPKNRPKSVLVKRTSRLALPPKQLTCYIIISAWPRQKYHNC